MSSTQRRNTSSFEQLYTRSSQHVEVQPQARHLATDIGSSLMDNFGLEASDYSFRSPARSLDHRLASDANPYSRHTLDQVGFTSRNSKSTASHHMPAATSSSAATATTNYCDNNANRSNLHSSCFAPLTKVSSRRHPTQVNLISLMGLF